MKDETPASRAELQRRRAASQAVSKLVMIAIALFSVWRSWYYVFNAHKGFVNNSGVWTPHIAFEAVAGVGFGLIALVGLFIPGFLFVLLEAAVVQLAKAGVGLHHLSSIWDKQEQTDVVA